MSDHPDLDRMVAEFEAKRAAITADPDYGEEREGHLEGIEAEIEALKAPKYVCGNCDFDAGTDPLNLPRCPNCGSRHCFEVVAR